MVERIWSITKATLGIGAFVICALLAAQKLDRDAERQAARAMEPVATGSIRPATRLPAVVESPRP